MAVNIDDDPRFDAIWKRVTEIIAAADMSNILFAF